MHGLPIVADQVEYDYMQLGACDVERSEAKFCDAGC